MTNTLTKFLSEKSNFAYINNSKDSAEREKRLAELKNKFLAIGNTSGNFSSVRFSADVSDVGNEEFSFMNDVEFNFAAYNRAAKQQAAFSQLKKLTLVHSVKDSIKQYLTSRNSVIKANKKKKAEADKLHKNGWQST